MLTIEKVIMLKGLSMFSKTSEEILAEVASILEEVELKAGEVVFEKGDVGESMYIIADGRVRVYDGDKIINHLDEKEIFGELALLDPEPRSASVQAVEETRRLLLFFEVLPGSEFSDQEQALLYETLLLKLAESQIEMQPALKRLAEGQMAGAAEDQTRAHIRNIETYMARMLEELSSGRAETMQELRAEIRLLARPLAASLDTKTRAG